MPSLNVNRESSTVAEPDGPNTNAEQPAEKSAEENAVTEAAGKEVNTSTETNPATPNTESNDEDSDSEFNKLVAQYQQKYFSNLTNDSQSPNTQQTQAPQATPSDSSRENALGELRDELRKFTQSQAGQGGEKQDPQLVDFFAKGDFKGAEDYLQEKAYARVMSQVENRFAESQNQILERAMSGIQAKMSLDSYLNGIMSKSPEVAEFRDYVEFQAEDMVRQAQQQGRIKNVQDYVEAKQAAYATTAQELKKRLVGARGKGKEEALKVKEKTLTSTPVSQGNPSDRSGSESTKGEPSMKNLSVSDYIAARRDKVAKQRGL